MCISIPRLRLQGFAKIGSSVFIPVRVGRGDAGSRPVFGHSSLEAQNERLAAR
jgi:hypothetical protein